MSDTLFHWVERAATWPFVVLLFILFLTCSQGFEWRRAKLGSENSSLDSRFWYSETQAQCFFECIGERGRHLYAVTEVTLDLLFPLVYGTLFAAMMVHLYPRSSAHLLVMVPLVTAALDLVENVTLACLAWQFDGHVSTVIRFAALVTAGKTVLFIGSAVLLLAGAVLGIGRSASLSD